MFGAHAAISLTLWCVRFILWTHPCSDAACCGQSSSSSLNNKPIVRRDQRGEPQKKDLLDGPSCMEELGRFFRSLRDLTPWSSGAESRRSP